MFSANSKLQVIITVTIYIQGVPKNMGIQWRIGYRLCYESIVIPNFKSHNIIMSAKIYFMNRVKDCKDVSNNVSARWKL